MSDTNTVLQSSQEYKCRGWQPIDVPIRSKNPNRKGWQRERWAEAELTDRFNGASNVGVLLGEPSAGLIDVDLDCDEAIQLASCFLPNTDAVFGRTSRPGSHWLYQCGSPLKTEQFGDGDGKIVELRGTGAQTIFPPSIHPNGEPIAWGRQGDPSRIDADALRRTVTKLAAASLLARHWPKKGNRHDAALALAGGLIRAEWSIDDAAYFVGRVVTAAGDDEVDDRVRAARDTGERVANGGDATGWPRLTEIVSEPIVRKLRGWLGITGIGIETTAHKAVTLGFDTDASDSTVQAWRPFPTLALPEPIRSFVCETAEAMGCDPAYVALPALAVAASCIGMSRSVELKSSWAEPSIVWACTIGRSGTLKTPPWEAAVRPLQQLQSERFREHSDAVKDYGRELARFEAERADWKRGKKRRVDDMPQKPEPPVCARHIVSNTTVEAIGPILNENPRGILLARDELSGWLGSFDRYSKSDRSGDVANWLEMHRGGSVTIDRKTGQRLIHVPRAAVSIAGTIQPKTLIRQLGQEHFDNGLAPRLLLAMPPARPRQWSERDVSKPTSDRYAELMARLLKLRLGVGAGDNPEPTRTLLSVEARKRWIEFYNAHGVRQADATDDDLAAAFSKLEGYAARLALVVHYICGIDDPGYPVDEITDTAMRAGIQLAQWFCYETERVYAILRGTPEQARARELVEYIRGKGGSVTVRDLTCGGPRRFRRGAEAVRAMLQALVDAQLGYWDRPTPGERGGRPTERFCLNEVDNVSTG